MSMYFGTNSERLKNCRGGDWEIIRIFLLIFSLFLSHSSLLPGLIHSLSQEFLLFHSHFEYLIIQSSTLIVMLAGVVSYCTRGSRLSQSNRLLLSGMRKAHLAYKKLRTLCKRPTSAHSAMDKFIMEYSMSFPIDESWLFFYMKIIHTIMLDCMIREATHNSQTTTAKMYVVIAGSHSRTDCPCRWLPKESSLMK